MNWDEWFPIYEKILSDMGYDRLSDENSARLLKTVTLNSDLISEDELSAIIEKTVSVFGNADSLISEIENNKPSGTLISAGSATEKIMKLGIVPDIVVTDLDGDIGSQLSASEKGCVTLIHAHGDNADLIMKYAPLFKGRIMITTQSKPDLVLCNFGGFTDGDRAVCTAKHFGAEKVVLYGFDYENPSNGSETKKKKLSWAKKIIDGVRI